MVFGRPFWRLENPLPGACALQKGFTLTGKSASVTGKGLCSYFKFGFLETNEWSCSSQKEEAVAPRFLQHSEEDSKVAGLVVGDFGCLRYFSSASLKTREMEMILLFQLTWQRPFLNRHTYIQILTKDTSTHEHPFQAPLAEAHSWSLRNAFILTGRHKNVS